MNQDNLEDIMRDCCKDKKDAARISEVENKISKRI